MKRIIMMFMLMPLMALATTLSDGLVAHYKFDGNANDSSGNGNDGVVHGATLTTDRFGNENSAFYFDGDDDYIQVPCSQVLKNVRTDMTFVAWIRPDEWSDETEFEIAPILSKGTDFRRQWGFSIRCNSSYELSDPILVASSEQVALRKWQHVAITYDGKVACAYLDGVEVGRVSTAFAVDYNDALDSDLLLGVDPQSFTKEFLKGALDGLRIYNRALSSKEILSLYNDDGLVAHYKFDGDAKDSSGNGNHGVVHGATLTADRFGDANSACAFDGDDWISVEHSSSLNDWSAGLTISVWMKPTNWHASGYGEWIPIVCKADYGYCEGSFRCQVGNTAVGSSYQMRGDVVGTGANAIELGVWQMITMAYNGSTVAAYKNGCLIGTVEADEITSQEDVLSIGRDIVGGTEYFIGSMDDLRIYNRALSASEVKTIYNEGVDPIVYRTVTFDGNGGVASADSRSVKNGAAVGELPPATRAGYDFVGWFTAAVGGDEVSAETVVTADVTYFAQWKAQEPDGGPYTEVVDGIEWTFMVKDGEASVGGGDWNHPAVSKSTAGAIEIPSQLGGYPVTSVGDWAFIQRRRLTSVTIPEGVTSIGRYAFRECSGLTSMTIPEGVMSIGLDAFSDCSGLTSVTIPEGMTSIGRYAFHRCSGLTSVVIPKGVTSIGDDAFSECSRLTSVTIPSSVTSIGDCVFVHCSAMTSYYVDTGNIVYKSKNGLLLSKSGKELIFGINGDVTIPEGVTSIGDDAFRGCSGLTSVTIPPSVTSIGSSAFCGCYGLTSVTIPEGVTSIGRFAFASCSNLTNVMMPEGLTSIGDDAFSECGSLTSVTIPEGVIDIGDSAFWECGLTDVTIPGSVIDIGDRAFAYCRGLMSVVISEGVTSIGNWAFSGSALTSVTIPSSVTSIGDGAFECCAGLMSYYVDPGNMMYKSENGLLLSRDGRELIAGINGDVTIPNGVTSIGSSAFSGCSGLTRVKIPSSVTSIGYYAFENCGLTSVVIPEGVLSIGWCAFQYCGGLTSVTLPSSVTNIGDEAFSGCSGLTSITIPEGVIKIGYESFAHCSGLKSVVMFEGVTEIDYGAFNGCYQANVTIPSSVTKIGDLAFCGCKGLAVNSGNVKYCSVDGVLYNKSKTILICCSTGRTGDFVMPSGVQCVRDRAFNECRGVRSVTIPASVTDIGECVFDNCQELKSFVVDPENATYQSVNNLLLRKDDLELIAGVNGAVSIPLGVTGIGENAFYWRTGLTSVSIPSSVAWIGERAFCCCRNLTRVTLPEGLTDIGEYAFGGCSSLMQVTIPASVEWIGEYAFSGCNKLTSVYVDEGDEDRVREMLEDSGFDTTDVKFLVIGDEPIYEVISGAKTDVDVGLVGYKATGLPKGLTLNAKGHVTGTTKAEGEYEVTFTKKGEEDETAVFVVRKESAPTLECEALEAGSFTVGVAGAAGGMPIAISAESGVKSVTQKNLPTGMKLEQDKTTKQWLVTGAPTKAGPCKVKLTVTTVAGNKVEKEFEIAVAALPDMVVGTFNGFVSQRKQYDAEFGKPFGAIQVTTTDAGKITAKITAAAKTYSFSATCWDEVKDGVYSVNVTLKTGEALSLMLDSSAGWDGYQLTGRFSFAGTPSDGSYYELSAQRNAFGKTWYFDVEGSEADGWRFSYADNPKTAALTLSLNADGKTSIAGKLGDLRVSASGYSDVSEMRNGCVIADFAPVVTVMDNKKSVKMLLAIRTNLWFDRSNDHELIGSAELVR